MKKTCSRELLTESALGRVELCTCRMLHVSIGPFTLRLEPEVAEELLDMLSRAVLPLAAGQGAAPAAASGLFGKVRTTGVMS